MSIQLKRVARAGCAAAVAGALLLTAAAAHATPASGADRLKDDLYGTKFVSPTEGWAVGAFGSVFHTADGGRTWQPQVSHSSDMLYDVDFADAEHGWIVGRSGVILATTDGGKTWSAQASGVDKHLFAVDFVDAEVGVVAGDWGAILTTHDGGRTWESHQREQDVILNDVVMIDRTHGWIVGERGTVLVTEDGGATWTEKPSGFDKTLFGVYFADAKRGWAVGIDALILSTDDGGATWTPRNGSTEVRELEQVGFAQAFDNPSLYAIEIVDGKGFAAGEIGAVFSTADGGQSWQRAPTGAEEGTWYRSLSVVGGGGAIVGAKGERLLISGGQLQLPEGNASAAQAIH